MTRSTSLTATRAAAVVASTLLGVLASLLPALPAAAAGGVTNVPPDNAVHLSADNCASLGSDQFGNTGWNCVAFAYSGHRDGRYYDAWGHNSVFCTNAAGRPVQCAGIHETIGIYGSGDRVPAPASGICGARFGHTACPAGLVENASLHVQSYVVPNEYWAASIDVSIVLPRSGRMVSVANIATSHYRLTTQASR